MKREPDSTNLYRQQAGQNQSEDLRLAATRWEPCAKRSHVARHRCNNVTSLTPLLSIHPKATQRIGSLGLEGLRAGNSETETALAAGRVCSWC